MGLKDMRLLFQLIVIITICKEAASNATFELNLLKFETLPNKCCDGSKWVTSVPGNCKECDPYFRICIRQMPGGGSKCVTTTKVNSGRTTDLTHGNIQPKHFSLDINDLQGSVAVDVDVKDSDITTKDDDIDHLFYTSKSISSTEKAIVVLNGTKIRLTISLKVSCKSGYYGRTCNTFCINGATWICSPAGIKMCKDGYSGPNCGLNTPEAPSSFKRTVLNMGSSETIVPSSTSVSSGRNTAVTKLPTRVKLSSENSSPVTSVRHDSEVTTETLANGDLENTSYTDVAYVTNTYTSFKTTDMLNRFRLNVTMSSPHPVSSTRNANPVLRIQYRIPEPLEVYSCNLMIEGHITGLHQPIEHIMTNVLTQNGNSTVFNSLKVHVLTSTFETTDNGVYVTDVSYIVLQNGEVLTAADVSKQLYAPKTSHLLSDHLQARNLKLHSPARTNQNETKQWVSNHLPFVIVLSCVLLFCFVVLAAIAVRSKRRRKVSSVPKKQHVPKSVKYNEDQTLQMFSTKVSLDSPFGVDNPLYDYSYDQLQPYGGPHV